MSRHIMSTWERAERRLAASRRAGHPKTQEDMLSDLVSVAARDGLTSSSGRSVDPGELAGLARRALASEGPWASRFARWWVSHAWRNARAGRGFRPFERHLSALAACAAGDRAAFRRHMAAGRSLGPAAVMEVTRLRASVRRLHGVI